MSNFKPEVGLITDDCYLKGCTDLCNMSDKGVIEYVGRDYFILRNLNSGFPLFIENESESNYPYIKQKDFHRE